MNTHSIFECECDGLSNCVKLRDGAVPGGLRAGARLLQVQEGGHGDRGGLRGHRHQAQGGQGGRAGVHAN